ncbi:hypothetical protein BC828DRAFT_392492 [Blastocladiella britannica]|nr:hypothetical protein BC828DRAFT_392492 [Blastocladiella britannica]
MVAISSTGSPAVLITRAIGITLHSFAVVTLVLWAGRIVAQRSKTKWTLFWAMALFTCLSLAITALVELSYASITLGTVWVFWTPMHTFVGDLFCRMGMLTMTACRLYRLGLSVKAHSQRAIVVQVVAATALLASLAVTTWLRINEFSRMSSITFTVTADPDLQNMRNAESAVTFVVFFLVQLISLLGDVLFNMIILKNAAAAGRQYGKLGWASEVAPYIPAAVTNVAYLLTVTWARVIATSDVPTWKIINYLAIMFSRFAPSVETFTFLQYTVRQTSEILRSRRTSKQSSSSRNRSRGSSFLKPTASEKGKSLSSAQPTSRLAVQDQD